MHSLEYHSVVYFPSSVAKRDKYIKTTLFQTMSWFRDYQTWSFTHFNFLRHKKATDTSPHTHGRRYGYTVKTLYSTIYYSKYFIELNIDKSTQYVALWTHKRHPIPRPFGRAMECLLWVFHWNWPCYKGFLLYFVLLYRKWHRIQTPKMY